GAGCSRSAPEFAAGLFEMFFEAVRAVALGARPRLFAVEVAAAAARVRVLELDAGEILLPIPTLLLPRLRAVADLHPPPASIVGCARSVHVAFVLVTRDRSGAKCPAVDRAVECGAAAGLHARGDEIAHGVILPRQRGERVAQRGLERQHAQLC